MIRRTYKRAEKTWVLQPLNNRDNNGTGYCQKAVIKGYMDFVTAEKRSEMMSKIRSKETSLEIGFRKVLWHSGIRYRKNPKGWFWKPDILIQKRKIAIFLDSCFWHGCPEHFTLPKTRQDFWETKIGKNRERDSLVTEYYEKKWWKVFRFWEHTLKRDMSKIALKIAEDIKNTG